MTSSTSTSNHLSHLLAQWYPQKDNADWVLATIYNTKGPSYRKAGAMMLFSSQGDQLGMLSGGCLESDIGTNARKVMQTGQSIFVCYDGSDEDDVSFQLGIGCGGTVYIMLQQINAKNDYLSLTHVYDALKNRLSGYYYQRLGVEGTSHSQLNHNDIHQENRVENSLTNAYFEVKKINDITERAFLTTSLSPNLIPNLTPSLAPSLIPDLALNLAPNLNRQSENTVPHVTNQKEEWLVNPIIPEPHLLVVGGGIDAKPLVNMAQQLGWKVSLWDPRPANARKEFFPHVDYIIKGEANVLTDFSLKEDVNAAVLMSHNVMIDAQALQALSKTNLQYLGLLGPENRRQQVIKQAEIESEINNKSKNLKAVHFKFAGPSGLDIGGSLPESIALSILSECHASLYGRNAKSMSLAL